MVTLWIGDFRAKQIQSIYSSAQQTAEYHYLVDSLAEYTWFKDNAVTQLPALSLESANVIIMLGFVDCLYSCVWNTLKIDTIAGQYANSINELVNDYPNINFYVCSVNPIDGDYPFAESKNGIVTKAMLDKNINIFNKKLKETCEAVYIDSYNYLINTSFNTRDGVRFTNNTCIMLHNYISTNLKSITAAAFLPRLTSPDPNKDTFLYWTPKVSGGENPFPEVSEDSGSTLPSCEAYAWGRFYEILGEAPTLSTDSAKTWYSKDDGYKRGDEPRVGAIACWTSASGGFVAVVEQVREDGSIITSESNWSASAEDDIWQLTDSRVKGLDGNWGLEGYSFQGFIYCPAITPTASIGSLDKTTVTSEDRVLSRSEMEANAKYIWNYLGSKGWSINAVAGMLGNMQYESSINPGRGQEGGGSGFGLVQWTPKTNLTDWTSANGYSDTDIDGQLERIIWEKDNNQQYAKNKYKYTFETFYTSLDDPYTLACAFAFDYERSWVTLFGSESAKETLRKERGTAAEEWYSFLAPFNASSAIEERFILDNFKLDSITPTEIAASFIVRNGKDGYFTLFDSKNKELLKESIDIDQDSNVLQIISLKCDSKLKPNTEYTIKIQATGIVGENTITRSITFNTPQDLPDSIKSIKLSCNDQIKSVNSTFSLSINMPEALGYWGSNLAGYEKQLIINGKLAKTKNIKGIKDVKEEFIIKDEFNYSCKTGDMLQIGIRILVTDINGKKIYDAAIAKTSDPICLLNAPIQAYLFK